MHPYVQCHYILQTIHIAMDTFKRVLFFILFMIPATIYGQSNDFGLKFGAQSTGINTDLFETSRVFGFSFYGFYDVNIHQNLFLSIDFGGMNRGFTETQKETNEHGEVIQQVEATSKLTYLALSPSVNVQFQTSSSFKPYVGVAPRLEYLIHRNPGTFNFTFISIDSELTDHFDDVEIGSNVAAGVKKIVISNIPFRFEARYEFDFTDSISEAPIEVKKDAFTFLIGITF